jgi:hypothetical protein
LQVEAIGSNSEVPIPHKGRHPSVRIGLPGIEGGIGSP